MTTSLELNVKLEQKLSQQLIQSMEIIAMSTEELNEEILKKAEANPLLRVNERKQVSYSAISDRFSKLNARSENYSEEADGEGPDWIEGMVFRKESLQEHLLNQVGLLQLEEPVRDAVTTLVTAMDRNGFFPSEPKNLLKEEQRQYLEAALDVVRQLDPSGVGAASWRESLLIQAEQKGVKGQELRILKGLVMNKLELVQSGKIDKAAKELGTDTGELEALMDFIRTLTPFPGRNYSSDYENYIVPELSVKKDEQGELRLALADDALPDLSLDPDYEALEGSLKGERSKESKEARNFLKEKRNEASSLITQVGIRRDTLFKLGSYLMDKQREFFLKGPLYLKGLTMTEAAASIEVSDSTVSRIASSKFIDTDYGILPIRELFSSKVASSGDENYSKNAVKEMIRLIIEENSTGKKLTDQRISDMLAEKGIKAARRTVAKYRSELDIDPSHSRLK